MTGFEMLIQIQLCRVVYYVEFELNFRSDQIQIIIMYLHSIFGQFFLFNFVFTHRVNATLNFFFSAKYLVVSNTSTY